MTRKDYNTLSDLLGKSFALAAKQGGEPARTIVYDCVYRPLVEMLADENPNFDMTRFSFACAVAEGKN